MKRSRQAVFAFAIFLCAAALVPGYAIARGSSAAYILVPTALSPSQLDEIIKQESISSGFSQVQIRAAIENTIEHGFSDRDAVKIVAVSEEVAFVRHVPLSYVVTQLLASINAGGESIIALDRNTAPLFHSHRHLSEVLKRLHSDFGKTFTRERCAQIGGC